MGDVADSGAVPRDYEVVARSAIKRLTAQTDPEVLAAIERLVGRGLAVREHELFSLLPPEHAGGLDPDDRALFAALRAEWLQADDRRDADAGDQLLYGELGYWTHWWNVLHERDDRDSAPLHMDVVFADDGSFAARDWVGELDPRIFEYVIANRLETGRAIVAPGALDTPSGDIVQAAAAGFQVRVFSSPTHYVIYDDAVLVLREERAEGPEGHRLTRRRPAVDPMRHLFALQWSMALPWNEPARMSSAPPCRVRPRRGARVVQPRGSSRARRERARSGLRYAAS